MSRKIFVLPVELLIVRGEGRGGETLLRVQEGIQAPQVELVQHALLLAVPWDHWDECYSLLYLHSHKITCENEAIFMAKILSAITRCVRKQMRRAT
jgi:hypothetical protein